MIVILGAGITGLTIAKFIKKEWIILEKNNYLGGLSTQYQAGEFWFDFSGHYFHFQNKEEIRKLVEKVCSFGEFARESKTFLMNRIVPFPVQYHLSYLPKRVNQKILYEIKKKNRNPQTHLHHHLKTNFGTTLFNLFFKPFLSKYYRKDLKEMLANMDKGSIPPPEIGLIIKGSQGEKLSKTGYNPLFYYPKSSLRYFIKKYAHELDAKKIFLNQEVIEVNPKKKKVRTRDGEYKYEKLISSIPLNQMVKMLNPNDGFPSFKEFEHISTLVANIVLKKRRRRFHWIYVADARVPFYRAGYYPLQKYPTCYLEKTVSSQSVLDKNKLHLEAEFTLKTLGMIEKKSDIIFMDLRVIPVSYVLFTKNWPKVVPYTLERLRGFDIFTIGRYGAWNYTSMSDDIQSAINCARQVSD